MAKARALEEARRQEEEARRKAEEEARKKVCTAPYRICLFAIKGLFGACSLVYVPWYCCRFQLSPCLVCVPECFSVSELSTLFGVCSSVLF